MIITNTPQRPGFTVGSNVYLSSLRFILFPAQLLRRAAPRENTNLGNIATHGSLTCTTREAHTDSRVARAGREREDAARN